MSLLDRAKSFGGNLLNFAQNLGEQRFAPDANPELEALAGPAGEAARARYDRNYRASRWQAIRGGAMLGESGDAGHIGATSAYDKDMAQAIAVAQALKAQRQTDGRTAAIRDYINSATDLSPQQKSLALALPEDLQGKLLGKHAFPQLDENAAAAGDVVSTFKGRNGNMWAMVQTGDPEEPVKAVDSGIPDDRATAEMRTNFSFAMDPTQAQGKQIRAFADKYGGEAATVQASVEAELPQVMRSTQSALTRMAVLREKLAEMPTGRLVGPALEFVSGEMQAINAELTENALIKIGQLKALGVNLQPITVTELKVLFDTSAQVKNLPAANVKILDRQMNLLRDINAAAEERLEWIDSGKPVLSYRPKGNSAPAAPSQADADAAYLAKKKKLGVP